VINNLGKKVEIIKAKDTHGMVGFIQSGINKSIKNETSIN
jgi:hypothetical protein